MKIGILTFHAAHNYGAVLQAYGLQEFLKMSGYEVEIIDYRPRYLTSGYAAFSFPTKLICYPLRALRLLSRIVLLPTRIKRRRGFEKFISQKLNLSREHFGEAGRVPAEKYDAIIFGSDQIWNPDITHGGDPVFLGNFPAPAKTLKIAYAASAGGASSTLGENPIFANALKNFDAISVRERNLADALQAHTNLKIETVLDPTLLASREVWEKLAQTPHSMPKKYVLVYQVSYLRKADRLAAKIAKQIGAKVVSIWAGYGDRPHGKKRVETPEEFVGWFKNAAFVITTSFHGTAFSLIFEKSFYFMGNGAASENRPKQILDALGLLSRYVSVAEKPTFSEINYADVNRKMGGGMEVLRERSAAFLAHALALRKTS